MARIALTERRIQALQPDPTGRRRLELRDSQVPGLVVRIAAKRKVYCLHTRFPGKAATRRVIAPVGAVTLDDARNLAREWLDLIRRGIDPAVEAPAARGRRAPRARGRANRRRVPVPQCRRGLH